MINSTIDYETLSPMKSIDTTFDSVASIVNYLREPSSQEVVSSTTTSSVRDSTRINNQLKPTKKPKKEKESVNLMNNTQTNTRNPIEITPSGRVRYGPILVNPRKQASKTLFTGRRSKYEILAGEEEEKRRLRRERNRAAATKCREKRENILSTLERKYENEGNIYTHLSKTLQQLQHRKQYLESFLSNHMINCPSQQQQQQPSMVFGDTSFLSSIMETPAPPLPSHQFLLIANDEEEFNRLLQPTPVLTNSAADTDQPNYLINTQQQPQLVTMSASSLERMINNLNSPTPYIDNNNNTCTGLFNSAYGSSCAQQHSSSSEDDSLPPTHKNPYVC